MNRSDAKPDFKEILHKQKLPLLVLDQKWHSLFAAEEKPRRVQKIEKELNASLARQGYLNQELKELKNLKSKLLTNIVINMDEIKESGQESKKLKADRKFIGEINEKIEDYEDELEALPTRMKEINEQLMVATMSYCYGKMRENEEESKEIGAWITRIRIELKKKIIYKQNIDDLNREMYSYLHDILGAQMIDVFDVNVEEIDQT
ncbi:MAG: hypothetical protein RR139_04375 [Lachnospiraceae bacterium]